MAGWADARDPKSLSTRLRRRRDRLLRAFIERCRAPHASRPFRILDLGGTVDYWRRVGFGWLAEQDIEIVCVNHIATEFGRSAETPRITARVGDACDLHDIADNAFDLVHSNSVIEHVGRWPDMRRFAREARRVAPAYYVQTPYFWFPIDPHFFRMPFYHWLPESWRVKLVQRFRLGYSRPVPDIDQAMGMVSSNMLLDRQQYRALFFDAEHRFEWLLGLPKSMIALREPVALTDGHATLDADR